MQNMHQDISPESTFLLPFLHNWWEHQETTSLLAWNNSSLLLTLHSTDEAVISVHLCDCTIIYLQREHPPEPVYRMLQKGFVLLHWFWSFQVHKHGKTTCPVALIFPSHRYLFEIRNSVLNISPHYFPAVSSVLLKNLDWSFIDMPEVYHRSHWSFLIN